MSNLHRLFSTLLITKSLANPTRITSVINTQQCRFKAMLIEKPEPGKGKAFRR